MSTRRDGRILGDMRESSLAAGYSGGAGECSGRSSVPNRWEEKE